MLWRMSLPSPMKPGKENGSIDSAIIGRISPNVPRLNGKYGKLLSYTQYCTPNGKIVSYRNHWGDAEVLKTGTGSCGLTQPTMPFVNQGPTDPSVHELGPTKIENHQPWRYHIEHTLDEIDIALAGTVRKRIGRDSLRLLSSDQSHQYEAVEDGAAQLCPPTTARALSVDTRQALKPLWMSTQWRISSSSHSEWQATGSRR